MKIDYELLTKFDLDLLKEYRLIPYFENEIKIKCYGENILKEDIFKKPIKLNLEYDKKEFEFELLFLKEKVEIFLLLKKAYLLDSNELKNAKIIDKFFKKLFSLAIKLNSSDVHIELNKNSVDIRFRIDGELIKFFEFDKKYFTILSTIIKIYANLDITATFVPLDSRFSLKLNNNIFDFRVSIMPLIEGESIVIRILNNQNRLLDLEKIEFEKDDLDNIKRALNLSKGLILVTGPTGSGKTTTLYAMLKYLNNGKRKIITIEDPVEYFIEGINQININEKVGLDYFNALKSILRQDPDIILVGEIRDSKTLQIAIQASLTGHLVLATLHTNNTIESLTRLIDLGAKEFLIASVIRLIIAQRLVKIKCNCQNGCKDCNYSGYFGRKLVSEVLMIDKEVYELILKKDFKNLKKIKIKTLKEKIFELFKNNKIDKNEFLKYEI